MKKIIFGVFLLFNTLSFSKSFDLKGNDINIPMLEFKTTISSEYDFYRKIFPDIAVGIKMYKPFYVSKINTIFNVGGGFNFVTDFYNNFPNNSGRIKFSLVPTFLFEVGGYLHKDVKMYAGFEMGTSKFLIDARLSAYLNLTYKEHFLAEVGYTPIEGIKFGIGARFGINAKIDRTPLIRQYIFAGEDTKINNESLK